MNLHAIRNFTESMCNAETGDELSKVATRVLQANAEGDIDAETLSVLVECGRERRKQLEEHDD